VTTFNIRAAEVRRAFEDGGAAAPLVG